MPWKLCKSCKEISYSASTLYESWSCPNCGTELKEEPEYDMEEAKCARKQALTANPESPQDSKNL